jgi:copper(I)-binding protein
MQLRSLFFSAAALLFSISSYAQEFQVGDIRIERPYVRATMPGQTSAGAYLTLENKGKNSDTLISVASPAAKSVEIHTMSMEGNVMKMREVSGIELKPAAKVEMKPGHGFHIMLTGIKEQLKPGDKIPLTLTFEKSGKTEVSASVVDTLQKPSHEKSAHQHRHKHH